MSFDMNVNNYFQDTTSSSFSEINIAASSDKSSFNKQNLITYELIRNDEHSGFGFDLKGDRPCTIGSVRKGTIADRAGLQEGDVVISINNKKVTELLHDDVVKLVGKSKLRLVLQVTKIAQSPKVHVQAHIARVKKPKPMYRSTTIGIAPNLYNISKKPRSRSKRGKYSNITASSQSTASSSGYGYDINLTTNTKTTEDDEDESDLDFYYGNGAVVNPMNRRRKNRVNSKVKEYYFCKIN